MILKPGAIVCVDDEASSVPWENVYEESYWLMTTKTIIAMAYSFL